MSAPFPRGLLFGCLLSALKLVAVPVAAQPTPVTTKVIDHGPDANHLVVAVLGDGYTAAEAKHFLGDVTAQLTAGLFQHDFYRAHASDFNVYAVTLASKESGVRTADSPNRDTALHTFYNGKWGQCWMAPEADTDVLVTKALRDVPKVDLQLIILNIDKFGGCARGKSLMVTRGESWTTVAHEYGHGIAELLDEYVAEGNDKYPGPPNPGINCSTETDTKKVSWADLVTSPPPPTPTNDTVGAFPGCDYYAANIYRPSPDCRMNALDILFCKVCARAMTASMAKQTSPHPAPPPRKPTGVPNRTATPTLLKLTHTRLLVEIDKKTGALNVLAATSVPGEAPPSPAEGAFVYQLMSGDAVFSVGAFQNPFVQRSYGPPNSKAPHGVTTVDKATVQVDVPALPPDFLINKALSMKIFERSTRSATTPLDFDTFERERLHEELRQVAAMPAASFSEKVKQKLSEK